MSDKETTLDILLEANDEGCRLYERDLWEFTESLYEFCDRLVQPRLPDDWRARLDAYLDEQEPKGFQVLPEHRPPLLQWVPKLEQYYRRQRAKRQRQLAAKSAAQSGATIVLELPPGYPTPDELAAARARDAIARQQRHAIYEERHRQVLVARRAMADPQRITQLREMQQAALRAWELRPIHIDDYVPATQQWIRVLGPDWKNVTPSAMRRLRDAGQLVDQHYGSVFGHGANAFQPHTFVRLRRKDGGVDTAHFGFVRPWLTAAHWELVEIIRGRPPEHEAAALAAREKIRHADVMRVRRATVRCHSQRGNRRPGG